MLQALLLQALGWGSEGGPHRACQELRFQAAQSAFHASSKRSRQVASGGPLAAAAATGLLFMLQGRSYYLLRPL